MVITDGNEGSWPSLVRRIGLVVDIEASVRQYGALRRARKLGRGEDLLRARVLSFAAGTQRFFQRRSVWM